MRPARISQARLAGLAYLAVVLTGMFALAYVPSALGLGVDNGANSLLIAGRPGFYRLGLLGLLANQVAFVLLPLLLWRLLARHGATLAALMVAFALTGVPVVLSALGFRLDALALLPDHAAAALALDAARNRMLIGMTFWGLWLLPLGVLVWRSGVAPRWLAGLLMLGCFGYLLQVAYDMLALDMPGPLNSVVRLPAMLGEIGFCLWLLLFGGRVRI
ncbi:DUF4386 domain-containing protein [Sandaracinobacter neustonicus]|uniref:DUF4386 domain-containing protein n=1 Tax=Sandaracinobacter neustonicus TaxID=1715348 RepID=A0A501XNY7_9SPHN|nr:DUF4386 domain-containing protein [Sandaracinobacter neustonicus]TPE62165.1 DUF4386 domain-containing protein [Sandaracinobacter neustonicus]